MIKLIKSQLQQVEFSIIHSDIELPPPPDDFDLDKAPELETSYQVEGDFMIRYIQEDETYRVFAKIAVNRNKALPGYIIYVEGMGVFSIPKSEGEDGINNFLMGSAVPITFNNLRNFIANTTSEYSLGKYILPIFDLRNLLNYKYEAERKKGLKSKKNVSIKSVPAKKIAAKKTIKK